MSGVNQNSHADHGGVNRVRDDCSPTAGGSTTPNTATPGNSPTPSESQTPTPEPTPCDTATPSETWTPVPTKTPGDTETPTPSNTPVNTETSTPTDTPVDTNTPTETPTETPTDIPTPTDTPDCTRTPCDTPTETPTPTQTSTDTPDCTLTPCVTPTGTATETSTPDEGNPTQPPEPTPDPNDTPTTPPGETPTPEPGDPPTFTPQETPPGTPGGCSCSIVASQSYFGVSNGESFDLDFSVLNCPNGYWDFSTPAGISITQIEFNVFRIYVYLQKTIQFVDITFTYGSMECYDSETITIGVFIATPSTPGPSNTPLDSPTPDPGPTQIPTTPPVPTSTPEGGPAPTPTCPQVSPENKLLNVPFVSQGDMPWCWAACLAMICDYFDFEKAMCQIVTDYYVVYPPTPTPEPSSTRTPSPIVDCCAYPLDLRCQIGAATFEEFRILDHYGFACAGWQNPSSFLYDPGFITEIQENRPIRAAFSGLGGAPGHSVLIIGYDLSGADADCWNPEVLFYDPNNFSPIVERRTFNDFRVYDGRILRDFIYHIERESKENLDEQNR